MRPMLTVLTVVMLSGLAGDLRAAEAPPVTRTGDVYFIGQSIPVVTSAESATVSARLEWVLVDSPSIVAETHALAAPVRVFEGLGRVAFVPTDRVAKKGVYFLSGDGIPRRRILLVDPVPELADPLTWPFGMIQPGVGGAAMAEEFYRVGVRLVKSGMRFRQINEIGKSDDPAAGRVSEALDEFLTRCKELGILFMIQPGSHYSDLEEPEDLKGPSYEGLRRIQSYYKGRIYCWSLGNEVNGGGYSRFTQRQYAQVVKNMSIALRSVDPDVKLAPGELYDNGGYLTELARPEYADYWDILTVHKVCGVAGTPCRGIAFYLNAMRGLNKPIWDTEVASGSIHGGPSAEGIPQNMRSWFPHESYDDEHGNLDKSVVRSFCLETPAPDGTRFIPAYYNPNGPVTKLQMFLGYHYNGSGHTLWALRKRYTPEGDQPEVTEGGRVVQQVRQQDAQNHKVAGWRTVTDMLYGAEGITRIPNTDVPDPYNADPRAKYDRADGYVYRHGAEYLLALWQNTGRARGDRKMVLTTDPADRIVMIDSLGNAWPLKNENGRVKVWVPMNIFYLRGFTRLPHFALDESDDDAPYFVTEPIVTAAVGHEYWYNAWAYDPDIPTAENDSLFRIRYHLVEAPEGMVISANSADRKAAGRGCLLHWKPTATGSHRLTIRATSDHGRQMTVDQTFTINVVEAGAADPVIFSQPMTNFARAGYVWRYNVRGFDPAGGALRFALAEAPAGAAIDAATGFIQWTAAPGRHRLRVTASRPDGRSASQLVVIDAQ